MDQSISHVFIAIGIIAALATIIVLLVLVHNRQREKKKQEHANSFSELAAGNGLDVFGSEELHNRVIGWDVQMSKVLFVYFGPAATTYCLVEPKKMKSCRIISNKEIISSQGKGKQRVTDQYISSVELEFQFRGEAEPNRSFTFYEHFRDPLLDCTLLAERAAFWKKQLDTKSQ